MSKTYILEIENMDNSVDVVETSGLSLTFNKARFFAKKPDCKVVRVIDLDDDEKMDQPPFFSIEYTGF